MLKRFYSKRSGFTLVEIVVAFAIFALMSAMVAQVLDLSVRARQSNNDFARSLEQQEHELTLVEKDNANYDGSTYKEFEFAFLDDAGNAAASGTLKYEPKASASLTDVSEEGINYFLSNVNYASEGTFTPGGGGDDPEAGGSFGSGTQAARYDTRITGTGGIGRITIYRVVKDTHDYSSLDPKNPLYLAPGHTRYLIEIAASSDTTYYDAAGAKKSRRSLLNEDVPYSQYRLYFYTDILDPIGSSTEYTDSSGNTYTKDVYKAANIVNYGYLNNSVDNVASSGLTTSNTTSVQNNNSPYTVQQQSSNCIRVGSPFYNGSWQGADNPTPLGEMGLRFDAGKFTRFYVDFDNDPHLTAYSFGANAKTENSYGFEHVVYEALPVYEDEDFDSNGNPNYTETDKKHVNIYGAFINKRNY